MSQKLLHIVCIDLKKKTYLDISGSLFALKRLGFFHQGPGQLRQVGVIPPFRHQLRIPGFLEGKTYDL